MPFTLLKSRTSVHLKVRAKKLDKFFADSLKGMMTVVSPESLVTEDAIDRSIVIESSCLDDLLIDFLNEILSYAFVDGECYPGILINEIYDNFVDAELKGACAGGDCEEIRSIAYLNEGITKKKGFYETTLVFDL